MHRDFAFFPVVDKKVVLMGNSGDLLRSGRAKGPGADEMDSPLRVVIVMPFLRLVDMPVQGSLYSADRKLLEKGGVFDGLRPLSRGGCQTAILSQSSPTQPSRSRTSRAFANAMRWMPERSL